MRWPIQQQPITRLKIKTISDLPAWFDLRKYADAKNLNAIGWYEQFTIRASCWYWIEECLVSDWVSDTLQQLRASPILNLTDRRLILNHGGGALDLMKYPYGPELSANLQGVHPMTVREAFWAINHMTGGRKLYAERFAAQVFSESVGVPVIYKAKKWLDEPIQQSTQKEYSQSNHFLSININLPDKLLIENFKRYLADARSSDTRSPASKRQRESFYSDWIAFGVLPYLDLKMWALETGVAVSNRIMADAIFPAGSGGEEVVRKTTKPLAASLMGKKMQRLLEAKAGLELAESYRSGNFPEN